MKKIFIAAMFAAACVWAQDIDWTAKNITITTAKQLYEFAEQVNNVGNDGGRTFEGQTLTLANNIDLNGSAANRWIPIGDYIGDTLHPGNFNNPFQGVFDGAGYTVKRIYVLNPYYIHQGFFGAVGNNGVVKNLRITESFAHGSRYVGLLAGTNYGGTIENCSAEDVETAAGGNDVNSGEYLGLLVGTNYRGTIRNCYSKGSISTQGQIVGGLVGVNFYGIIENCYSETDIEGANYAGGLVGLNGVGGNIKNSYATGNVYGRARVGGLAGSNIGSIENCYATGNVTATSINNAIDYPTGGLVGIIGENGNNGSIKNCYATGNVTGPDYVGGLVGSAGSTRPSAETSITNCYAIGKVTAIAETPANVGGLAGYLYNNSSMTNSFYNSQTSEQSDDKGKGAPKTTAQMKSQTTYTDWDFTDIWAISDNYPYLLALDEARENIAELQNLFAEKSNEIWDEYEFTPPVYTLDWGAQEITITTAAQLAEFRDRVCGVKSVIKTFAGQTVKLGANIDLEGSDDNQWTPIGLLASTVGNLIFTGAFDGTFDGAGFEISGLYIKIRGTNAGGLGLFAAISAAATIKNLGLVDAYVDGLGRDVGGLVGFSRGSIENCYVTGDVFGGANVGGLAGSGYGSFKDCWTNVTVRAEGQYAGGLIGVGSNIENCYALGDVYSLGYMGGLVGGSYGYIKNSYATGNVTGFGGIKDGYYVASWYVGGLVGISSDGYIEDCYATGDVYGAHKHIGGLVGFNGSHQIHNIKRSYATGNVSGPDVAIHSSYSLEYFGGLVGCNGLGSIENSYSTGKVSVGVSATGVGGLAGGNGDKIEYCYSAGEVAAGKKDVGGLVGGLNGGIVRIRNSFYDKERSKQNDTGKGAGKTTAEMKNPQTYANWNFTDIWGIGKKSVSKTSPATRADGDITEINDGYPYLRALFDGEEEEELQEPTDNTAITPAKSGKNLGIVFAKNVVSVSKGDKLEIAKVVISRDGNKEVIGQITKTVIYDNTGNVVFGGEGANAKVWNLRNKSGRIVANGSYLVIVEAKDGKGKTYWYSAKVGVNR